MENSIIEELYYARCDDYENSVKKIDKDCNKDLDIATGIFEEILQIVPKRVYKKVLKKQEDIYYNALKYSESWNKRYYKLGIQDGLKLKQEIKKEYRDRKENEENFILDYESDFNDFFEAYKVKVLYKNEEYSKIIKGISEILETHPKLRDYYEDNKIQKFNENELKALLKFINLTDSKNFIEVRTAFKLGLTQDSII